MRRRPARLVLAGAALAAAGLGATPIAGQSAEDAVALEPCGQDAYENGLALRQAVADGNGAATHHSILLRPGCIYALVETLVIRARSDANGTPLQLSLSGAGAVIEAGEGPPDHNGTTSEEPAASFRVLDVEPGAALALDGIVVRGGRALGDDGGGGGIRVGPGARLTLTRGVLSGNSSTGSGAALAVFGDAVVADTTISGNRSGANGSIVEGATRLRLDGVTVSGNRGDGGATVRNTGFTEVVRSTLAGNAGQAAVVENTATLRMAASTVAANGSSGILDRADALLFSTVLAGNGEANCAGDQITATRIISTDATCTGTIGSVTLGSLRHNGGPTRTKALRHNSSGVDPGPCEESYGLAHFQARDLAYDQRGVARDASCDIGAFERLDADADGYDDLTETG